jgi:crotonobetaine/carnitine-CoA ligase
MKKVKKLYLINQLLDHHVGHTPNNEYLFTSNETLTYRDLHDRVIALAASFNSLGVNKGDRVALYLRNKPEFLYSWLALNRIGAIMVPINTALLKKEVSYILNDSQVVGLIGEDDAVESVLNPAASQCQSIQFNITTGSSQNGWISMESLLKKTNHIKYEIPDENDLASILYTSGTTGNPKGVMCPHRYYFHLGQSAHEALKLTETDRLLTCLPLFHMNAQILTITISLLSGSSIVLLDKFQPAVFWQEVEKFQATAFFYLGSILPLLLKLPVTKEEKHNTVRLAVGAQADPRKLKEYETRWSLEMIELFGMTEGGGTINRVGNRRIGSCGTAFENHKIKIVDERGNLQLPLESGEIIFTGPSLTLGYWNNPAETQKSYRNGWMYSGDMGYMDADGFLYFLDRKKDIIRRNGENISSAEIERVLLSHPKIMEAAAIPVPDVLRGEEIKVYIVIKPGVHIQPEEIIEWCESIMAKYKIPRFIEFRESLPKTATQKIQKEILKNEKSDAHLNTWDRRNLIT